MAIIWADQEPPQDEAARKNQAEAAMFAAFVLVSFVCGTATGVIIMLAK